MRVFLGPEKHGNTLARVGMGCKESQSLRWARLELELWQTRSHTKSPPANERRSLWEKVEVAVAHCAEGAGDGVKKKKQGSAVKEAVQTSSPLTLENNFLRQLAHGFAPVRRPRLLSSAGQLFKHGGHSGAHPHLRLEHCALSTRHSAV